MTEHAERLTIPERDRPVLTEQLDDRLRKAREIAERGHDWLVGDQRSFVERYVEGSLKLAFWRTDWRPGDYGVILEAWPNGWKFHARCRPNASAWDNSDGDQAPMLASDIKCVESDQGIIPSRIRLHRFEDSGHSGGKGLYEFAPFVIPLHPSVGALRDWKVDVVLPKFRVAVGDSRRENIKATAKPVDDRPDLSVDNAWKRFGDAKLNEMLSRLRVRIVPDQLKCGTLPPSLKPLFEGWELGYGPIDTSFSV